MKSKIPKASLKLTRVGAKFRRDVLREYEITDTHDLRRLDLAAQCLDRIYESEPAFLKRHGLLSKTEEKLLTKVDFEPVSIM